MKRRMTRRIRKSLMAVALVGAIACGTMSNPGMALAWDREEVDVPSSGNIRRDVSATFTISDGILGDLGYSAVASIPVSMSLDYDWTTRLFTQAAVVYCSGVLDSGKKISITVNESGEKYGKVYDPSDEASSVAGKTGYSVSLSKTSWSKAECRENLEKISDGLEATKDGELSISVPGRGFIPSGMGTFKTYAPLVISMEDA